MSKKIAIFTLTKDRLEYTQRTFKTLWATIPKEMDHVVVDNGSTDGTIEWLKGQDRLSLIIHNEQNLGISRASNQAVNAIMDRNGYDYIIKVDNDCDFIDTAWLPTLLEIQAKKQCIISPFVQGLNQNSGGAPRLSFEMIAGHRVGWTGFLGGICTMIPARAFRKFRWQENRPYIWGAMSELTSYCKAMFPCGYAEDVFVEHMDGTLGQEMKYPEYFKLREVELVERPTLL
jgi:GT2 family glycosyltransferase